MCGREVPDWVIKGITENRTIQICSNCISSGRGVVQLTDETRSKILDTICVECEELLKEETNV